MLATGGYDHTIKIFNAFSSSPKTTLQHNDSQVNCLAFNSNNMIAAGGFQSIKIYDWNSSNNPVVNFDQVNKNITSIGFQENGRFMFTGSEDSRVRIWDLSAQHTCKRVFDCLSPVLAVCLHPNQVELAIATANASIFLWNISNDYNEQLSIEINNSVKLSINSIDISKDGRYMAAINNKGYCYVWDLLSSEKKDELTKMNAKIKFVAQTKYGLKCKFSPDSKLLATTGGDGTARIYKTDDDFKLYKELKIEKWMWDLAFSNDSKYLFIASSDGTARLWKLETKTVEREYTGHSKALTALAFKDETILN